MKSLRNLMIAMFAILFCSAVRAEFRVCNTGADQALTVAFAQRSFYGIQSSPIEASGWYHVSPGTCQTLYVPVIDQGEFWVLDFSARTLPLSTPPRLKATGRL